jgi:hypothetical protein
VLVLLIASIKLTTMRSFIQRIAPVVCTSAFILSADYRYSANAGAGRLDQLLLTNSRF